MTHPVAILCHRNLVVVVHAFNPALERSIRWEKTALTHSLILRFREAGLSFQTEVEVKPVAGYFAFLNFRVSTNFCL